MIIFPSYDVQFKTCAKTLAEGKDAKTMGIETLLTVRKFSNLLQDATAAIQEYSIFCSAALDTLQRMAELAERFKNLQTPPMPPTEQG